MFCPGGIGNIKNSCYLFRLVYYPPGFFYLVGFSHTNDKVINICGGIKNILGEISNIDVFRYESRQGKNYGIIW